MLAPVQLQTPFAYRRRRTGQHNPRWPRVVRSNSTQEKSRGSQKGPAQASSSNGLPNGTCDSGRSRSRARSDNQSEHESADSLRTNVAVRETTPQVEEKTVPEIAEDDESWTLVSNCRAKPSPKIDLGIERMKGDATTESLEVYIHARCKALSESVTIHRVKVFPLKEGREEVCARITVNASDALLLKRRGFWPGRLYCRDWQYGDSERRIPRYSKLDAAASSQPSKKSDDGIPKASATPITTVSSKRSRESPVESEQLQKSIFARDPDIPAFARWTGPRLDQIRRNSLH